jgi:hypothetical protein
MLFLSYSREDSSAVGEIAENLKKSGWDVWMDVQSIAGGDQWRDEIAKGITNADAVVLNVSPSACSSDYVRKEVFFAIRHGKPVVPVMVSGLKSVELPYALELELGHLHFLRWPDDGVGRIADAIKGRSESNVSEDDSVLIVKEMLDSSSSTVVSLGKDFIAFKRLISIDAEMAVLRAVRIINRCLCYMSELLGSSAGIDAGGPDMHGILQEVSRRGLITNHERAQVRHVLDCGATLSMDISEPSSTDTATHVGDALGFVHPICRLLAAFTKLAGSPAIRSDISGKLEVVKGSMVSKDILQQAFLVGQRTFGETVMPSFSGMERMHEANPDVYNLLIESSTGMCVGYTSVVPLDQTGLEETLHSSFDHIHPRQIQSFSFPGFYFVHLSSIAVDPAYRDLSNAYSILNNALLEDFLKLTEKDIYIVGMSADAITANGHRICQSLGMLPVVQREGGSTLFYGSLMPPSARLTSKAGLQLMKVYKRAYEEMADVCPQVRFPAK